MENLKRLLPYLRPHRKMMALTALFMVLSGGLSTGLLVLMDRVLRPMLNPDAPNRLLHLNVLTLVVFAIGVARVIADFGQVYFSQRTGQRILTQLRLSLFSHLQELSVGFFEQKRTGEIMSRLTNDLSALQTVLTSAVNTSISAPVEVAGALAYMIWTNGKLSFFVLIVLPPIAFLINRAGRKIRGATTNLQQQLGALTNYLQEKVAAMRLIQTFGAREHEIELFNEVNQAVYQRTMKPIRVQAVLAPIIEFTGLMGVMLCLWFGAREVRTTDQAAALFVFLFAMHRVAMRAKALANLNLMFKQADAAAARLFELIDTQPDVRDAPDAINLKTRQVQGHLRFDNVRFSYPGRDEVLHGISFEIAPGRSVALAGLSGSGKSTIAALVPRLYDPSSGRVCVDGLDLRDVSLDSLRAHIGAVPQQTTLFHGTIRDNISYGKPGASLEEVVAAARDAHADEFIRDLPQGYDTSIGERGGQLSGGQQQRLAIARALLRDPKILILDEATSSLDAQSERLVQDALATLMHGRTTLIIAHRFSTIQSADQILVLDEGRIAETGTHEQLLREKGRYFRLYQMQAFASRNETEDLPALDEPAANAAMPALSAR